MARANQICRTDRERGQSAIELALALPTLLLIVLGTLDLGRAFFAYVAITNAAREGARYGVANPASGAGIVARVNHEFGCAGTDCVTVVYACSTYSSNAPVACSAASNGDRLGVQVTVPFDLVSAGLLPFGSTITLSNYAVMAITNGIQSP